MLKCIMNILICCAFLCAGLRSGAQKPDESNPKIYGSFAFVNFDTNYRGWTAVEYYKQYTCIHCHKTITTQAFRNPQGEKVILSSLPKCPLSPDGNHIYMQQTYTTEEDQETKLDVNSDAPDAPPVAAITVDKDIAQTMQKDTAKFGKDINPRTINPDSGVINSKVYFNIDSVYMDKYLIFFYTVGNITSVLSFRALVRINDPSGSAIVPEEIYPLQISPNQNYFMVIPSDKMKEKVGPGYNLEITIADINGHQLKSTVSRIKKGRKGSLRIVF